MSPLHASRDMGSGPVTAVIAVAALIVCVAGGGAPSFALYTIDAVISLPYAAISEPVRVYYDLANNKSRAEYYNGQDIYIYRPDLFDYGTLIQIVPETVDDLHSEVACFQNNGSAGATTTIQSIIPDLTLFTNSSSLTVVRGVVVENWEYNMTEYGRINTYNFYISAATGEPVQYIMMGYDSLYGSHYDQYVIDYMTYYTTPIDQTLFNPPDDLTCGGFPGPGAKDARSPRGAIGELVENISEQEKNWDQRFDEFKAKYNKKYADHKEHMTRHAHFRKHTRYVESMNRKNLSFKLAINHMGDYTEEERRSMRGARSSKPMAEYLAGQSAKIAIPQDQPVNFDWRPKGAVSPVKDQGICGSCWSFGTAESIEGAWFIATGYLVPISEQAFMDCSWQYGNNGCDGGEAFRAYEWALDQGGAVPSEAGYGIYQMADGFCHAVDAPVGAVISSYTNVTANVNATVNAIYSNGPLAVAIDASHLSFVFYSSGVYYEPACGNTPDDLDHEVLAIGYGTTTGTYGDYWIVKNSWSQYWGNDGYVWMSRYNNNCGVATDANFVVVSA